MLILNFSLMECWRGIPWAGLLLCLSVFLSVTTASNELNKEETNADLSEEVNNNVNKREAIPVDQDALDFQDLNEAEKRFSSFRTDLGKRFSGFRTDLGKRPSGFRSDLGKRLSGFRSDLGKREDTDMDMNQDMEKRYQGFRSDLGKRYQGFRTDLGKRDEASKRYMFRNDLGKRFSAFRSDLGKRPW